MTGKVEAGVVKSDVADVVTAGTGAADSDPNATNADCGATLS